MVKMVSFSIAGMFYGQIVSFSMAGMCHGQNRQFQDGQNKS
jgi:hypothetical protein